MQATAPDSVGVKMPDRMPPRMIAIVIMPQIASMAILTALRNGTISPLGNLSRYAMIRNKNDQRQTEQQSGDDAAHEQVSHRDRAAGGDRINDHVVRGRDEKRLQRARDRDIDGEQARIAVLDHLRNHYRADRRGIGDGRTRDAAEHGGGDDVDERHPAADEADEDLGEVDEAFGHAADRHDRAGENEERDCQQRETAHAARDLEHHRFNRGGNGGNTERIGDGHAHQTDDGKTTNEDEDVHDANPSSVYSVVSWLTVSGSGSEKN